MRIATVLGVVACASACAVACLLPDLGTIAGGSAADASIEAATEGGTDAGADREAGFCARAPKPNLLCDDFDDSTPLSQWTGSTKSFAELVVQPNTFVSPPFAVRMRHPPRDAGADGTVSLQLSVSAPVNGFRASFQARINTDIPTTAPYQEVFQVWPSGKNVGVYVSSDFVEVDSNMFDAGSKSFAVLPVLGKWQAWVVTFTRLSGGAGSIEVRIDGVQVAILALPSTELGPVINIVLGPEHLRVTDDWSVEYDDVLITAL